MLVILKGVPVKKVGAEDLMTNWMKEIMRLANTLMVWTKVWEQQSVTRENTGCSAEKTRLMAQNRAKQGQTSLKGEARVTGTS